MTRKIVFITLACSMLLAYGYHQTRLGAHTAGAPVNFRPSLANVEVSPPAGSVFVRSYESKINGKTARFAHYVHALDAAQLVDKFMAHHPAMQSEATATVPHFISSAGCTSAGFIEGSDLVTIIAFDVPGGSTFFLTRSEAGSMGLGASGGDAPGIDAPGVPRPVNSFRRMSVENLGGIESVLAFYEGWGGIDEQLDHFRTEMQSVGWKESPRAGELMSRQTTGEILSFSKARRHCLIYCEKNPRTGLTTTAVMYRVKDWLPPEAAY